MQGVGGRAAEYGCANFVNTFHIGTYLYIDLSTYLVKIIYLMIQ